MWGKVDIEPLRLGRLASLDSAALHGLWTFFINRPSQRHSIEPSSEKQVGWVAGLAAQLEPVAAYAGRRYMESALTLAHLCGFTHMSPPTHLAWHSFTLAHTVHHHQYVSGPYNLCLSTCAQLALWQYETFIQQSARLREQHASAKAPRRCIEHSLDAALSAGKPGCSGDDMTKVGTMPCRSSIVQVSQRATETDEVRARAQGAGMNDADNFCDFIVGMFRQLVPRRNTAAMPLFTVKPTARPDFVGSARSKISTCSTTHTPRL